MEFNYVKIKWSKDVIGRTVFAHIIRRWQTLSVTDNRSRHEEHRPLIMDRNLVMTSFNEASLWN